MDNICHTLAGLALGEAGLKRKTALGNATLMVAANVPDVDALSYLVASPLDALGFRRGITHGLPAMLIWPFVVTALMLLVSRLERRWRPRSAIPDPRSLVLLSAAGVLTHPALDWLNTYGMRWLSPFSDQWYYGDAVFIVDPWMWAFLLAGVIWSARRWNSGAERAGGPARLALACSGAYALLMLAAGAVSERAVRRELERDGLTASRVMAAPVPLNPLRRTFVAEARGGYLTGTVTWPALAVRFEGRVARRDASPLAQVAAASPEGRTFLSWSRFPVFRPSPDPMCELPPGTVCILDMRYWPQQWASVAVTVERPVSLQPTTSPE